MPIPGNLLSPTTEMVDPNTSGWTAKLNATLSKGVGGRNGDGCLLAKSVEAGEVQARTVSSYPVTAGTVYYCFADASGASSTQERIGIRWMAGSTELSVSWSLPTMTAAAAWHRVSVAAAAPAGATQAQVLLSSTAAGVGVNHFWENVYLGLPIRTLGNLLPFNTESSELDASGWTPVVNATVSRQVPVVAWAATNYTAGGHALAMTAQAAGNASILSVDRPTVAPGREYLAYAYLQPPTVAAVAWIELRFYDANGNQISATRSVLAPPTPATGMYRQRVSATAPANAATCSLAAGLDGASAGQVLRLETIVIMAAPEIQAGSVLPYADASFEQGLAGWSVASGVATIARTTPWGLSAFEGSYSLTVTSTTATTSTIRSGRFPVREGVNWRAQIVVHPAAGTWSTVTVRVRWYDAANASLGVAGGVAYGLPGTSWYALQSDQTAPAGATQAAVEILPTATAANSVLHVDRVALWEVLPLTAVTADSERGYTTLTLRELPLDYTISVYRVGADGARRLVRGTSGLIDRQTIVSDILIVEDHEAPMGTPVSYHIAIYSPSGSLSTRSSGTVTLTLDDINEAWLKDPANPQRNMRVVVEKAPDWQRPIEQSSHVVRGRRNKVIFSGRRQGLEGDLAIATRSDEERQALHLLLDSGNLLLWQAAPGMGVDDMYVAVGQVPEARLGRLAQEQWRTWTLPLVEQDMPVTVGVNGAAGRTCQDVLTEFATCADLLDVYDTSEDLLLDRRG
ncbi:conserved hypothetical protein [Streptomyces viridosporus ATCC 14672]|uniref:CBM-cenC domain-containing protein n=1 Tax=Streptomyces viridosporus (strain ATCC 14672 / DSM 40746 / JCM 4963 / KCTC 9882 / NRRL B-12104 / FH 1290) TaxID=566461 RepID=D6A4B0_STRV1|nr:hypothetical protein [Streptomyces viridosporus]EFE65750.1 conserved hypothetical protein [Streptomyces viridosporus ATCC 14672]